MTAVSFNQTYHFFFHPCLLKKKEFKALSIGIQILFTAITGGIWLIPVCIINKLDRKKIEVWKKGPINHVSPKVKSTQHSPTASTITVKAKETAQYVHLLGDSTLDNCYWFLGNNSGEQAKVLSVHGQLNELFKDNKETKIKNHAYDGFTTHSLLKGDTIGRVLGGKEKKVYEELRQKGNNPFVNPLEKLKGSIEKNPDAEHKVVLSVGGNDFRVLLSSGPQKLLAEIPQVQERYLQILEEIKKIQAKVQIILCFQYKTVADKNLDHYQIYPVMAELGKIMLGGSQNLSREEIAHIAFEKFLKQFYQPIAEQAKKDNLPILDLSHTFDPKDSQLYICGIEPSEKGGKLIAEGIHHIVTHHQPGTTARYAKLPGTSTYTEIN